jgi:uncharacterized membrane protein
MAGVVDGIWLNRICPVLGSPIWFLAWAVKKANRQGESAAGGHNALDIAKIRYTKGEITRDQYEQIKKDIA